MTQHLRGRRGQAFGYSTRTTLQPTARPLVDLGSEDGTRRFQVFPRRSMPVRGLFGECPGPQSSTSVVRSSVRQTGIKQRSACHRI